MTRLTYLDAGVDIEAGEKLVKRIAPIARSTSSDNVIGGVGGFAGLYSVPDNYDEPVLVCGADGVGTKLKLAFELNRHSTIGIDLVAMCVNDILTVGAKPLFFVDYFATSKLDVGQCEAVIKGIAEGCQMGGCSLLGGETAELPGFYAANEYDMAGFAVGVVDRKQIVDGRGTKVGDQLVGVASSGLHSNGFSLVRRVLEKEPSLSLQSALPWGATLGDVLLEPTRIYAKAVQVALTHNVRAMCHITGGGLPGNLLRTIPDQLGLVVDLGAWELNPIFTWIQERGAVAQEEMLRTFNMGVGFTMLVAPDRVNSLVNALSASGECVFVMGKVVEGSGVTFF